VRNPSGKSLFQNDEFSFAWKHVWSAYFDKDDEFDEFMQYFVENACTPPKRLALEEEPLGLFVCAERCKEGHVAFLALSKDGRRERLCMPDSAPPPVPVSPRPP
jgi:hypothetical protein